MNTFFERSPGEREREDGDLGVAVSPIVGRKDSGVVEIDHGGEGGHGLVGIEALVSAAEEKSREREGELSD